MSQGQSYPINFLRRPDNFDADPFVNNLSTNNPAYPYSSIFTALFAALGYNVRTKAATDYYVDPVAGNDAGTGAIGSPWKTFAHAQVVLFGGVLDFAGQTVTLHVVNDITEQIVITPWVGGGAFVLDCGGKKITYTGTNIRTDGLCFLTGGANPGPVTIQNVKLIATKTWSNIYVLSPSRLIVGPGVVFGGGSQLDYQLYTENAAARIDLSNAFTIGDGTAQSGSATQELAFANQGFILAQAVPMTFANAVTYGHVLGAALAGNVLMGYVGNNWVNPGNVTARQAFAETAGTVSTFGNTAAIPGTANTLDATAPGSIK